MPARNHMTDDQIFEKFGCLYDDLSTDADFPTRRPLLSHYTSLTTLENILKFDEVWLSNPLLMNDHEEVRFGVMRGTRLALTSETIADACGSSSRADKFREIFSGYLKLFEDDHAFDTYVFCLSEHDPSDYDGRLSMWRGYGGNGSGVAIVMDTAKLHPSNDSPLIIARVHYATAEERATWIENLISKFSDILRSSEIPDDKLFLAAYALFERIKIFALFSKHSGFNEEREWRIVYVPERDTGKRMTSMLQYFIGANGAEPKLKLKIDQIADLGKKGVPLEALIERIILGPSTSSPLAHRAVERMLERLNKNPLKNLVYTSGIPFRPKFS
jgi:hypothetical protein